jgi:hypothetical protein
MPTIDAAMTISHRFMPLSVSGLASIKEEPPPWLIHDVNAWASMKSFQRPPLGLAARDFYINPPLIIGR